MTWSVACLFCSSKHRRSQGLETADTRASPPEARHAPESSPQATGLRVCPKAQGRRSNLLTSFTFFK